jgi:hypothetical protein
MKTHALILCALFLVKLTTAQIDSSDYKDHSLYLYKTEEDFFNKKKSYRGQYIYSEDKKILRYTTFNGKKRTLDLSDSCNYYFGYQIGDETQIRPYKDAYSFTYYTFGGGTREYYCVVYGYLPNYDRKGYLVGLTSPSTSTLIYFMDNVNDRFMVQLPEFLKPKSNLLAQYQAERGKITMLEWERKKLEVSMKYFKLFQRENKSVN